MANDLYNQYLDYWELQNVPATSDLTDDQRAVFQRMYEMSEALRPCIHTLAPTAEFAERVRGFIQELGASSTNVDAAFAAQVATIVNAKPIIRDSIKLSLAAEATDTLLRQAEDRAPELIALVANRSLSERAGAYLDRATRLYLWGFDPETIVMCAAVLESAYEDRFPDPTMFALQVRKTGQSYEPYEYERAAVAAGVFDPKQKRAATGLRRARNDILHNVPTVALSANDALILTAELLERLFPASGSSG